MSRSGYTDDFDEMWTLIMYRGQVASAMRGKRGQAFLRELLAALDAMPAKKLIREDLIDDQGSVCALGALGAARGYDLDSLDPYAHEELGKKFGVARQLVAEIEYENDDQWSSETPEKRWQRMREWVAGQIIVTADELLPCPPESESAQ